MYEYHSRKEANHTLEMQLVSNCLQASHQATF